MMKLLRNSKYSSFKEQKLQKHFCTPLGCITVEKFAPNIVRTRAFITVVTYNRKLRNGLTYNEFIRKLNNFITKELTQQIGLMSDDFPNRKSIFVHL